MDIIPGGSSDSDTTSSGAAIEGVWETFPGSSWSDKGPIVGGKAAQGGGASGNIDSAMPGEGLQVKEQESPQVVRLEAKVLARRNFYEERPGFNPLGLLMNPMVLLGIVAMGITFGMPYLMDNRKCDKANSLPVFFQPPSHSTYNHLLCHLPMSKLTPLPTVDPEIKAEFEETKKNSPLSGVHRALQEAASGGSAPGGVGGGSNFDLASWMAGAQKSQQGVTSGADVKEGGSRRRG